MNSLIFKSTARLLFWAMLVASLVILWRGHNQPGGGFVGGLVAAMAFGVVALSQDVQVARRRLRVHPVALTGLGVLLAVLSGLPGMWRGAGFLTHQWLVFDNGFKLSTTLVFDVGVYCSVMGGMLCLVLRLYEDDAADSQARRNPQEQEAQP
ncbi:Na(+)/H(+) antiporter subunit B [Corticibacter populi]|uniref:Na(+)/H(+) antiporter subunit B n=1 Tax=Corticibacter populi TaxID=1550736 RepID=A0A3M6R002_9BURK|nr:MnhB domain-containing protein [Corticibacter populi]RMX08199.1 Na(+)/H(+) antiporter subunit B [Corticibacter populi]RZS35464.1 multisubunit sodium/proton antiporter MrpB subunit [Corticibacter populi]